MTTDDSACAVCGWERSPDSIHCGPCDDLGTAEQDALTRLRLHLAARLDALPKPRWYEGDEKINTDDVVEYTQAVHCSKTTGTVKMKVTPMVYPPQSERTDHGSGMRREPPPTTAGTAELLYPCDRCGKLQTKAEGGTVFTFCDECWNKRREPPPPEAATCPRCKGRGAEQYAIAADSFVSAPCAACNGTGKRVAARIGPPLLLDENERLRQHANWIDETIAPTRYTDEAQHVCVRRLRRERIEYADRACSAEAARDQLRAELERLRSDLDNAGRGYERRVASEAALREERDQIAAELAAARREWAAADCRLTAAQKIWKDNERSRADSRDAEWRQAVAVERERAEKSATELADARLLLEGYSTKSAELEDLLAKRGEELRHARAELTATRAQIEAAEDVLSGDNADMRFPTEASLADVVKLVIEERDAARRERDEAADKALTADAKRGLAERELAECNDALTTRRALCDELRKAEARLLERVESMGRVVTVVRRELAKPDLGDRLWAAVRTRLNEYDNATQMKRRA
jgi:hypothetical protein